MTLTKEPTPKEQKTTSREQAYNTLFNWRKFLIPARNKYTSLQINLFLRAFREGKISIRKLWNVVWCNIAYWLKLKKSAASPYILSLELWNECNAGCLFCRDKKGKIHDLNPNGTGIMKGKLPPEVAKEIVRQVKDDVLIAVLYTNGEPLLYKDLPEVIQTCTDNKVTSMIATNGLLFTEQNAKDILNAGVDLIKIQLGGFTQDIYSIQIRYGHVERLKENIRMLARMNKEGGHNAVILIDYILYNYNRHQLPLVQDFVNELGLMMNIRPGNPAGGLEDKEPALTNEELPLKISCDWLWKAMQVNYNGEILQCCEGVVWSGIKPYTTFKLGETNVKEVWNGPQAIATRLSMKHDKRTKMPICQRCTRRGVCFKW